jgi:hypothetical protein
MPVSHAEIPMVMACLITLMVMTITMVCQAALKVLIVILMTTEFPTSAMRMTTATA